MPSSRYLDWLRQAKADLKWKKIPLENGFFPQAFFISQQTAEKALKVVCYYRDYDLVKSHLVRKIAEALDINGAVREAGQLLDQFYIPARYPDGLPEGSPQHCFTKTQATQAFQLAAMIIERVEAEFAHG